MRKTALIVVAGALVIFLLPVLAGGTLVVALGQLVSGEDRAAQGLSGHSALTAPSQSVLPPAMLELYVRAADTCPGLGWNLLAAIGTVESSNGTSDLPGVHSGHNPAGAEGPMQFEPRTFEAYAYPVPAGGADPPSPYDPTDAVFAAARMLCANGAGQPDTLGSSVFDYNHSLSYVAQVLDVARSYANSSFVVMPRAP